MISVKYNISPDINIDGKKEIIKNDKLINYISCHDNNTLWDKLVIVENNLQEILIYWFIMMHK